MLPPRLLNCLLLWRSSRFLLTNSQGHSGTEESPQAAAFVHFVYSQLSQYIFVERMNDRKMIDKPQPFTLSAAAAAAYVPLISHSDVAKRAPTSHPLSLYLESFCVPIYEEGMGLGKKQKGLVSLTTHLTQWETSS